MRYITILALLCPFLCMCQPVTIKGKIINEQNEPVPSATIIVKRTSFATTSNTNGQFQIPGTRIGDTLVISAIGYLQALEILDPTSRNQVTVILKPKTSMLEEVVINTGYQLLSRERATGSFSRISTETFNERVSPDWLSRLNGISSAFLFDRRPGSDEKLQIRGLNTLRSGGAAPLIVLDNFPYDGDVNNINPNDIESIVLLKDAAAASIWGARAGNGVIVITTKKGKTNKPPQLSFSSAYTIVQKPDLFQTAPMPSSDFIDVETLLFNQGFYNSDINNTTSRPPLTPAVEILLKKRNGTITSAEADAQLNALRNYDVRRDMQQYLYQKAFNRQLALSVDGGSNLVRYIFSVGYDNNTNALVGNNYHRFTLRSDNTFTLFKNLRLNAGLSLTTSGSDLNNPGGYGAYSIGSKTLYPYARLINDNGMFLSFDKNYRGLYTDTAGAGKLLNWKYKPLDELSFADHNNSATDLLFSTGLNYSLSKSLLIDVLYRWEKGSSLDRNNSNPQSYFARNLVNRYTQVSGNTVKYMIPVGGILDLSDASFDAQYLRGQFNFDRTLKNKDHIVVLAGAEVREISSSSKSGRTYGYSDANLSFTSVDYANSYPIYGSLSSALRIPSLDAFSAKLQRAVSVYANSAYTFKNRYTISASARKDASNLFGVNANHRWTPLWSVGGLWNIANENFYKLQAFPELRLRASYGFRGNVANDLSGFSTIVYQDASSSLVNLPFARIGNAPNPELRWEKVGMLNLGLDFALAGKRVSGSIEYYIKNTRDLLGSQTLDPTTGLASFITNSAHLKGNGIDVELRTVNVKGRFSWQTNWQFSYTTSKITRYLFQQKDVASNFISNGNSINPFQGLKPYDVISFKWAGLDPQTGDPQGYVNGNISKDYPAMYNATLSDLVISGPGLPPFFGGLHNTVLYKGFSVSANITYRMGYYFRRSTINYSSLVKQNQTHIDYIYRWQKPGDEQFTNVPSFIYPVNDFREGFYNNSEITVERGDHVRLEYISLSYSLNKSQWNKMPFQSLQFFSYANDLNILLWKKNKKGLDPDYPYAIKPPPSFSFGFKTIF